MGSAMVRRLQSVGGWVGGCRVGLKEKHFGSRHS